MQSRSTGRTSQRGAGPADNLSRIPGSRTQAHSLDAVRQMATEMAALMLGVPISDITIDVQVVDRPAGGDLQDTADTAGSESWRSGVRTAPPAQPWPRDGDGDVATYGVEPLLSLQQAASELGESRATLRRRVLEGSVPALKLAGRWKVRLSDLR